MDIPEQPKLPQKGSVKHGLTRVAYVGGLPEGYSSVTSTLRRWQKVLEALVFDVHGRVSAKHAMLIQTVTRHEQACLCLQRWLREHHEELTIPERMAIVEKIGQQSAMRDRTVEKLDIDQDPTDVLAGLYDSPTVLDAMESLPDNPEGQP